MHSCTQLHTDIGDFYVIASWEILRRTAHTHEHTHTHTEGVSLQIKLTEEKHY